jgi:uncharacterized 2Fe-2S/4Fe-4S cluster protein (DUF4445 family)
MEPHSVQVIFQPMNRVVTVPAGIPLLAALRDAGIQIESICGGKGLCRKCRVILDKGQCGYLPQEGAHRMSPEEQARGYYYACQVRITSDCEFTIPVESRIDTPKILLSSRMDIGKILPAVARYRIESPGSPDMPVSKRSLRLSGYSGPRPQVSEEMYRALLSCGAPAVATVSVSGEMPEIIRVEPEGSNSPLYGVAADLGTTTVVGCLVNLATGEIEETASTLNRQITYGEELITRIGYSGMRDGLATLQRAAAGSVREIISQLTGRAGIRPTDIADITVAANTVMNHLLCGIEPDYLEMANAPVPRRPILKKAAEIGLEAGPDTFVYCLPNVSRFVGGDAVGDVISSSMHTSSDLSLLIDMGTNGEIILGNSEWQASVSCASGPAFEGGGLTSGMRAMRGAIEHIRIDPVTSELTFDVIGNVPPRGICGSGIIDAAAEMVEAGILDFAGKLREGHPGVRRTTEGPAYLVVPAHLTGVNRDILITQRDIDYLMDSKAATCGGIAVLLKKYKIRPSDIRQVYLAGAFGTYADIRNIVRFGIIPDFVNANMQTIGNGSLSGAYAALVSQEYRKAAEEVAEKMVYIDLLVDNDFIEEYSAALYIPGRRGLFPRYRPDTS